jgi:adenylylsulfate kinase
MGGLAVWITGLPGSGKSSIADAFKKMHPDFTILRMDELRKVVTPDPSYSDTERNLVYRSLVYLAEKLTELGHNVIIDATGNLREWREFARFVIPGYVEVYLKCDIQECRRREMTRQNTRSAPKDIYTKGEHGWPVPGVNAPYEEPPAPEIVIEADSTSVQAAADIISGYIKGIPGARLVE